MANEISAICNLTASKGGVSLPGVSKTKQVTMTGTDMYAATASITTTTSTLSFGSITGAPEFTRITNIDPTNFVYLSMQTPASTNPFAKLKPGYSTLVPLVSATVYALADTATCQLFVEAVET